LTIFRDHTRLSLWEEAVGQLQETHLVDGVCLAKIGSLMVVLPEEVGEHLGDLIGQRIGVLRAESGYKYRVISRGH